MGDKMNKKNGNFLGLPFLSIHEGKSSAIIVIFFLSSIIGLWQVVIVGDIAIGLLQWLIALLASITGINVNERYHKRKEKQSEVENFTGEYKEYQINIENNHDFESEFSDVNSQENNNKY